EVLFIQAHDRPVHFINDRDRYKHEINAHAQCRQMAECRVAINRTGRSIKPRLLHSSGCLRMQDRAQPMRSEQYRGEKMRPAVQSRVAEHAKDPTAVCADSSTTILRREKKI